MRAGDGGAGEHARAQALAGHFQQAELADLPDLDAGAIASHRIVKTLLDIAVVLGIFHVDEIDHDQARQIAQAKLTGDLVGGFEIRLGCGFLDRMLARRLA